MNISFAIVTSFITVYNQFVNLQCDSHMDIYNAFDIDVPNNNLQKYVLLLDKVGIFLSALKLWKFFNCLKFHYTVSIFK